MSPVPQFRDLAVLVDLHPSIPTKDARLISAAIHGVCRRHDTERDRNVDMLIAAIRPLVAQYGYTARLIGRTREAIEFAVTKE